jgi:hypothetical protein
MDPGGKTSVAEIDVKALLARDGVAGRQVLDLGCGSPDEAASAVRQFGFVETDRIAGSSFTMLAFRRGASLSGTTAAPARS